MHMRKIATFLLTTTLVVGGCGYETTEELVIEPPVEPDDGARDGGGEADPTSNVAKMALTPENGTIEWRADAPYRGITYIETPAFSTDGAEVLFLGGHEDGRDGLWAMSVGGGDPRLVVERDDPSLFIKHAFISVGEDRVYLTVFEYESDIWVMDLVVN